MGKSTASILYPNLATPVKSKIFRLGNKFFGRLNGDTFFRTLSLSRHLYQNLDGFGIDKWLVEELEETGCKELCFTEKEEAKRYRFSLVDFKQYAQVIDHGWGVQLICPRRFWQVENLPKQLSLEVRN